MDIYRDLILDHYRNPRNFGTLDQPTFSAEEENTSCGDRIRMDVTVNGDGSEAVVAGIRFSGEGCAISQASASLLTERVKGRTVAEVMQMSGDSILEMLKTTLTPSRVRCAVLPLEVLQTALKRKR